VRVCRIFPGRSRAEIDAVNAGPAKGRGLSPEDRALWQQVVSSVNPLPRKRPVTRFEERPAEMVAEPTESGSKSPDIRKQDRDARSATAAPYYPPVPAAGVDGQRLKSGSGLDDKTIRRLKKGRLEIDATVDLHGMAQWQAHRILFDFIEQFQSRGARIVLVITGKGKGGEGILRQAVPRWLGEQPFRQSVAGWRWSHVSHGGEGALYVRLKKPKPAGESPR
jgi:DNA-nicking Smr family endonuclease